MPLNRNEKLVVTGCSLLLFGFIFKMTILPAVINEAVRRQVVLKDGRQMRDLWGKLPFPLSMQFYLFNVTNPDQVALGEKPILQEVGPFVYDEWLEKRNQIDHEEDDSISYNFHSIFYFNANDSEPLTGEEEVIVPNYFALVLANTILIETPSLMPLINRAIDSIFRKPNSLFLREKARNILFDGIQIDCNVSDAAGKVVCKEVHARYDELRLRKENEFVYSMSLWGAVNDTDEAGRHRVYRGIRNIMDIGQVLEYDDRRNISVWRDEYCDTFNGTDGTIFHPFFNENGKDDMVIYNSALCRNVVCRYDSKVKYAGFNLLRYIADLGIDAENNPQHRCFCRGTNGCPKRGIFDAYECAKAPLIYSNPHFYLADPYYVSMIDGMKPIKEKHALYLDLQAFTGAPLVAHVRVQINMFLTRIQKFRLMRNFPDALLPLFWFDRVIVLPQWVLKEIRLGLLMSTLAETIAYLMMFVGLVLCLRTIYLCYRFMKNES